jgi:hypothetical protein
MLGTCPNALSAAAARRHLGLFFFFPFYPCSSCLSNLLPSPLVRDLLTLPDARWLPPVGGVHYPPAVSDLSADKTCALRRRSTEFAVAAVLAQVASDYRLTHPTLCGSLSFDRRRASPIDTYKQGPKHPMPTT